MNKFATINDCKTTEFSSKNSNYISYTTNLFQIKRLFYVYNNTNNVERGNHAHLTCKQLLIAASGSFHVQIDDGLHSKIILLNTPDKGLFIPAGIWISVTNISADAVCLVLASHPYEEVDYIRDYPAFLHYRNLGSNPIQP